MSLKNMDVKKIGVLTAIFKQDRLSVLKLLIKELGCLSEKGRLD